MPYTLIMINIKKASAMGKSDLGWLKSNFHFSFAGYYNPLNMQYGVLRVINDDYIMPHTGFDTHPHNDMEIISYVLEGNLSHKDSMGHSSTLQRGHVQYLSAGTGITHSEYNHGDTMLHILQIWILPDKKHVTPQYGEMRFEWENRLGKLMPIAAGDGTYPITIHQDIHMDALFLHSSTVFKYSIKHSRKSYVVLAEGTCTINNQKMEARDGAELPEGTYSIKAETDCHLLFIEMKKA